MNRSAYNESLNRALAALLPQVSYELVQGAAEREALFRLRYKAYLEEGAIAPNEAGTTSDRFDELPNVFNIGVKMDGRLFGGMRICVWSREFGYENTPGVEVFREELAPYLQPDVVLIDPNRFVVDESFAQNQPVFSFFLIRITVMACLKFQATTIIATARREHCEFYRRLFGYQQLTQPRAYPGLIKPLALLVNDFRANYQPTIEKYPAFAPQGDDLERIFDGIAGRLNGEASP